MRARPFRLPALLCVLVGVLGALVPVAKQAEAAYRGCRFQDPQKFLIRKNFMRGKMIDASKINKALRYRVERYGKVEGGPFEQLNTQTAFSQAHSMHFMGLPIQVHKKIAPALGCVEHRLRKDCTKPSERYRPHAIGGLRTENSYRGLEVSNHLFGIAIDIDPDRNPCCGCVAPWPEHKACQGEGSIFERTELPRCWIDTFERYGFYWLGRDPELRDTMHFEFLGNPDRIVPP